MVGYKKTKIVIYGAGGFGKEVLWTLLECNKNSNDYNIVGFLDDDKHLHNKKIHGIKVLGGVEWFSKTIAKNTKCVIAIGKGVVRKKIVNNLGKNGIKFATIIHPSVIMSNSVKIGRGTIIQAGTVITVDVEIGNHCRVDTNCTIAHDSMISDFVDLSPNVHINGDNKIHTGAYLGSSTTTKESIAIGKWSVIGAGTVLVTNAADRSLYVGVPGKLKKKLMDNQEDIT